MCATLVIGYGVNFIYDYGLYVAQDRPAFFCREQYVERFRRSHQNVWRTLEHLLALVHERVTGADGHTNFRHEQTFFSGEGGDLAQRSFKVLLNVITQRLERRNVEDLGAVKEIAAQRFAHQRVYAGEECSQSLA